MTKTVIAIRHVHFEDLGAFDDGLPVGMMLVGKAFDEETIYRAAAAFEKGVDWKSLKAG